MHVTSTPHTTSTPFMYIECDLPEGVTLAEWRKARHADRRPKRRLSARKLATRMGSILHPFPTAQRPAPALAVGVAR
jgi:hypothetical protein